jgi:HK97 family phage major capsid protein
LRVLTPRFEAPIDIILADAMARGEIREHHFGTEQRATLIPSANTVPVSFLDRVYNLARLVGPYLETSEVFTRTSGEDLRIPVMTAYPTASESAAGSAISESEGTYDSLLVSLAKQGFISKISNELLTDEAELDRLLAQGAQKANEIAERTLALVYDRLGFVRPGIS